MTSLPRLGLFTGIRIALLAATIYLGWNRLEALFYLWHMESDHRRERLQVDRVVRTLPLRPSMRVADIGAGTGIFTFLMAEQVGTEGTVFAIEINSELTAHLRDEAEKRRISNVKVIQGKPSDPRLPEKVDVIFLCNVLHHVEYRASYIQTLTSYLAPAGQIAIIDFKSESSFWHRRQYTNDELDHWMEAAGLSLVADHTFLEEEFFRVYGWTLAVPTGKQGR